MKISQLASGLSIATGALAQVFADFEDENGIQFWQSTWTLEGAGGASQFGLAMPPAEEDSLQKEYIGRLVGPKGEGSWAGIVHKSGMANALMVIAWADGETVQSSLRIASGYVEPEMYSGNASLSTISEFSNETHFGLTYRCEGCWEWDADSILGNQLPATTSGAAQLIGWAQATSAPATPGSADSGIDQHDGAGIFGANVESARAPDYTMWTSLAATTTQAPAAGEDDKEGDATGTATEYTATPDPTPTGVSCPETNELAGTEWDYIVVGAGAGGIPVADKLSESGASVLLIERGPPSSGRWGGDKKPEWLADTNLTRFDVPGLDNQIWQDSKGISCHDVGVMAGCVLGGGTAINAGLWWRANPTDFDYNFPEGWKSADVEPAVERTFNRIPFNDAPSMDGMIYQPQGYEVVAGALEAAGWENVTAGEQPALKHQTFTRPNHMFSHGERGGPMATYLVSADARPNFKLITMTDVPRVVRDGSKVTGVEMEAFMGGGQCGVANLSPSGKVVLSAGAFGTPKILFRSGIGPQDQLDIVRKAEPELMVAVEDEIHLPVGENLDDHTNTDIVFSHPSVVTYDWYGAFDDPIESDMNSYLDARTGLLAQSAPNLAAVGFEEVEGDDGIKRQLQWTARVEGGHGISGNHTMVISQYLGRGATSRGRACISNSLSMVVDRVPFLHTPNDRAAVAQGIDNMREIFAADSEIEVLFPAGNTTTAQFLDDYIITAGGRTANHWMGTCKMGLDSGLKNNGTAVVDTNTKVYGSDNLFVVDASIFPGMVSNNPSALIVAAAEHAAPLIEAASAGAPIANNSTGAAAPSGTAPVPSQGTGISVPSSSSVLPPYPISSSSAANVPIGAVTVTGVSSSSAYSTGASSSAYSTGVSSSSAGTGYSTGLSEPTVSSEQPPYPMSSSSAAETTSSAAAPVQPGPSSYDAPEEAESTSAAPTTSSVTGATPVAPTATLSYPTTNSAATVSGTSFALGTGAGMVLPTGSLAAPTPSAGPVKKYHQCGGRGMEAKADCEAGCICREWNEWYSQCVAPDELK